MACITCGKSFNADFNEIVKRKKQNYDNFGTEYYIYRKDKSSVWKITQKIYFSEIYKKEKPSEYFHISEFKIN